MRRIDGHGPNSANRKSLLKEIFLAHEAQMLALFKYWGHDHEEAKDLTQETFLNAYQGLDTFRGEADLKTWLFKIALNLSRNQIRKHVTERKKQPLVQNEQEAELTGEHAVLDHERKGLVKTAIDTMPAQMKRCMVLRLYQELKYHEIASILKIAPATVKAHLYQGREHLKNQLTHYFGGKNR